MTQVNSGVTETAVQGSAVPPTIQAQHVKVGRNTQSFYATDFDSILQLCKIIGDKTRLRLIREFDGVSTVSDICGRLGISQPLFFHHITKGGISSLPFVESYNTARGRVFYLTDSLVLINLLEKK